MKQALADYLMRVATHIKGAACPWFDKLGTNGNRTKCGNVAAITYLAYTGKHPDRRTYGKSLEHLQEILLKYRDDPNKVFIIPILIEAGRGGIGGDHELIAVVACAHVHLVDAYVGSRTPTYKRWHLSEFIDTMKDLMKGQWSSKFFDALNFLSGKRVFDDSLRALLKERSLEFPANRVRFGIEVLDPYEFSSNCRDFLAGASPKH